MFYNNMLNMTLNNIQFDRKNLTIYGVKFPDLDTLNSVATALASQIYEGFNPTTKLIEIYRDYRLGKINQTDLAKQVQNAI